MTPLFSSSEFWEPVQGSCTTAGALPFSPRANCSIWQSNMSNDSRLGLLYFMRLELDVPISSAANLGHWCDQGCHHWSFCVHRISSLLSPPIIRSNFAKTSNSTPLWSGSAPQDFEKWIQSSLDGSSQVIGESPVVLVFLITNPETPKWTHRLNAE